MPSAGLFSAHFAQSGEILIEFKNFYRETYTPGCTLYRKKRKVRRSHGPEQTF